MAVYEYGIYIYEYKDIVNNTINEQDNTNGGLIKQPESMRKSFT